jgi:hypothetical protein
MEGLKTSGSDENETEGHDVRLKRSVVVDSMGIRWGDWAVADDEVVPVGEIEEEKEGENPIMVVGSMGSNEGNDGRGRWR